MIPILVYGIPLGSSMGLVAALAWFGQPYHLCRVDMLAEMKNENYARINPRLATPVLFTDDGSTVPETIANALWLEARDVDRRISFNPGTPEYDRMHQLMGFINTGFTGAFSPLWEALEMDQSNPAVLATLRDYGRPGVIERHNRLEEMVGTASFL